MRKISGRSVRFMPSAGAMAMKASAAQAGSISARLPPLEWVSTISRKRPTSARPTSPPGSGMRSAAPPTSPMPDKAALISSASQPAATGARPKKPR
jgi:hypothetical protein